MPMDKEDVHVRISSDVMRQVRAWADQHGLTLAAAVAVLLAQAVKEQS